MPAPFIDNPAYEHLLVYKGQFWNLYLNENQTYLFRSILWLNSRHVPRMSPIALEEDEAYEMYILILRYETAVRRLVNPDLFNYCWLGNEIAQHEGHGHFHLIPRYDSPREFVGVRFVDMNWGRNYAPSERLLLTAETTELLRSELASAIRKT